MQAQPHSARHGRPGSVEEGGKPLPLGRVLPLCEPSVGCPGRSTTPQRRRRAGYESHGIGEGQTIGRGSCVARLRRGVRALVVGARGRPPGARAQGARPEATAGPAVVRPPLLRLSCVQRVWPHAWGISWISV